MYHMTDVIWSQSATKLRPRWNGRSLTATILPVNFPHTSIITTGKLGASPMI